MALVELEGRTLSPHHLHSTPPLVRYTRSCCLGDRFRRHSPGDRHAPHSRLAQPNRRPLDVPHADRRHRHQVVFACVGSQMLALVLLSFEAAAICQRYGRVVVERMSTAALWSGRVVGSGVRGCSVVTLFVDSEVFFRARRWSAGRMAKWYRVSFAWSPTSR